jgi:FkbM family methyltransferase
VPNPFSITSGRWMNPTPNFIYNLLPYFEPTLLVDVGAAAGGFTRLMSLRSPESAILALEPFPGNWPFLEQAVADLPQVTVEKRAASDRTGRGHLYVSSVVSGAEKGWEGKQGYSSAGKLIDTADTRSHGAIDVETVRLDDLIDEPVRLLKVDVQGGEASVLRGCEELFSRSAVDIIWVEFSGDLGVLELLHENDFVIFDSPYLVIPTDTGSLGDDWKVMRTTNLSNGKEALLAWPYEYPQSAEHYCEWLRVLGGRFVIQTDLAAVRKDFLSEYFVSLGKALAQTP